MEDNRNKSHKGFKIFVLLLLVGIIFFINKGYHVKFIEAYKSLTTRDKSLELMQSFELGLDTDRVGFLQNNIALLSGDKLSIIDIDQEQILEKQFNFEAPEIVFGEKFSYVMDKSTGDIYFINNKGETVERVVLDNKISNLLVNEDNIIVHTKSEYEEDLAILDTRGVYLRFHSIEDMNILTYDLDKNKDKYLISNLIVKDQLKSQINVYSIDGELLNTNEISNEIIIFTKFVDKDLIVLSDKSLYYIKDDKIHWKKSLTSIRDVILVDKEIYILYGNNLEIINLEGRTTAKHTFTEDLSRIKYFEKLVLLWGEHGLVGIQGDKEILKYSHDKAIEDIIINKNYLGLVDDSSLHLFKVNNK